MKKELLRHIEILKTVPEIKDSIEELKFGCFINHKKFGYCKMYNLANFIYEDKYFLHNLYLHNGKYKIIGQVEERHLRMFLKENQKFGTYTYMSNDSIMIDTTSGDGKIDSVKIIIKIDNSKPYQEQSEEFFKKLNDWIVKEFNIKL